MSLVSGFVHALIREMCIISIHVHDVVYTLIVSIHCVYDVLYFVLLFAYYRSVPLVVA